MSLLMMGCQQNVSNQVLASNKSQVNLRSFQSRAFDTQNKTQTLRTIISTLQDLGFVLEKADQELGTVTGLKFVNNQNLKMSVSVRPRGQKQMLVRANAQYERHTVEDPLAYQDFFASLSKAMFLTAHEID